MLVLFYLNIHLQIVNRVVRHPFPASLAIVHTFGFSPHPTRLYLRNNHATTDAFPKTFFLFVHTGGTSQETDALSQTPLCSKLNISAVSTELCEHGQFEHSTPEPQPVLSASPDCKSLAGNTPQLPLSVFDAGIWDKTLCGTCIHTTCVIVSLSYFA